MSIGLYRDSEQADAPSFYATVGTFTNLLKKVLVDGYGAYPGLGWELTHEVGNKLVVRNKGTQMFLRVEHDTDAFCPTFRTYESMVDIDNGLFPCPPASAPHPGRAFIRADASTYACPWKIIGDDKGFWFCWNSNVAARAGVYDQTVCFGWKFLYVGDYIPYDPKNNIYNFCVLQSENPNSYIGAWYVDTGNPDDNADHYWVMRSPEMVPGATSVHMDAGTSLETSSFGYTPDMCDHNSKVQMTSIPSLIMPGAYLGLVPGLENSLSQYGYHTETPTPGDIGTKKPAFVIDYGDYKRHFMLNTFNSTPILTYFVIREGKGFRDGV